MIHSITIGVYALGALVAYLVGSIPFGYLIARSRGVDIRKDQSLVHSWYSDDNFKRQARTIELAKKYNVEPINIALAWVLNQKFPCFPMIGPGSVMEIQSSLNALPIKLTEAEMLWLNLETP